MDNFKKSKIQNIRSISKKRGGIEVKSERKFVAFCKNKDNTKKEQQLVIKKGKDLLLLVADGSADAYFVFTEEQVDNWLNNFEVFELKPVH